MASTSCGASRTLKWPSPCCHPHRRRLAQLGRLAMLLGLLSCTTQFARSNPHPLTTQSTEELSTPTALQGSDAAISSVTIASDPLAVADPTDGTLSTPPNTLAPSGWRNLIVGAVCAATLAFLGLGTLVLSMRRSILHPIEDPVPMKPRD